MNGKRYLLFAIVVTLLLPSVVSAKSGSIDPVSGTVQFVGSGAEKQTDKRIGHYYSMPTTGGEVTMRIGAYIGFLVTMPADVREAFDENDQEPLVDDPNFLLPNIPPLTRVRIRIYDREDPTRMLYEFDGSIEAFLDQPGIEIKFSGPHAALITQSVSVPEGQTWWTGQLETFSGVQRGHCNVDLIQGGLQAWIDAHNGTW